MRTFQFFGKIVLLLVLAGGFAHLNAYDTLQDANPFPNAEESRAAVGVWAEIDRDAPSIKLRFLFEGDYAIYRRLDGETDWGEPVVASTGTVSEWTDTDVAIGTAYEYGIQEVGEQVYGYITAGIEVNRADHRGTLILVVAENIIVGNEDVLTQTIEDLIGDGWKVENIITPFFEGNSWGSDNNNSHGLHGHDYTPELRNKIREIYYADPAAVRMIYFLGHTPLAQSGTSVLHPDGHGSRGPYVTDFFFADVDGAWTDNATGSTNASVGFELSIPNVPGDGIYDQNTMPSPIEIAFGRVDPFDGGSRAGNSVTGESHADTVRVYLEKASKYKNYEPYGLAGSEILAGDRAGIRWNPGGQDGAITSGLQFLSMYGPDRIEDFIRSTNLPTPIDPNTSDDIQYTIDAGPFNYYGQNSGGPDGTDIGGRAAHRFSMQSWWGDWWAAESSRKSLFSNTNMSVTWLYTGRFDDQLRFHPLGLGGTFGEALKLSANYERGEYLTGSVTAASFWERKEFLRSLVGDPTLRIFPVPPVRDLAAAADSGSVILDWTEPVDVAGLVEYRIYRADDLYGDFELMGTSADTTWTDTAPLSGPAVYQVRAVYLTASGSGTYFNNSIGKFAEIGLQIESAILPPLGVGEEAAIQLSAEGATGSVSWTVAEGILPPGTSLTDDGIVEGTPISRGLYRVTISATDDVATASREIPIYVDAQMTEVVKIDLRGEGGFGIVEKTQFQRQFTVHGDPEVMADGTYFDGDGDAIQIHTMGRGNSTWPGLNFLPEVRNSGWTFVASFKAAPDGSGGVIMGQARNLSTSWPDNETQYAIDLADDGKVTARASTFRRTSGTGFKDGEWHQVVYTLPHNSTTASLYLNGELIGTAGDGRKTVPEDFLIGARWDGPGGTALADEFQGQIADVRIYRTGISEGEVLALHERFRRTRNDVTPRVPEISGIPDIVQVDSASALAESPIAFAATDPDGEPLKLYARTPEPDAFETLRIEHGPGGTALHVGLASDEPGTYPVTLAADDDWPGHVVAKTIDILVSGAVRDEISAPAAAPLKLDLVSNDIPPMGESFALLGITGQPAEGAVVVENGEAWFYPPSRWSDPYTLSYQVQTPGGTIYTAPATIAPTNGPVAEDDSFTIDGPDTVSLDVLANDVDPLAGDLTISVLEQPTFGSARIVNGEVEYTSAAAGVRIDTFTYHVTNATGFLAEATATVTRSDLGSSGPLVALALDESSGSTPAVSGSDGSATATVSGTPSWETGLAGNALTLDGSTALTINGGSALQDFTGNGFSISFAVKPDPGLSLHNSRYTVLSSEPGSSLFRVSLGRIADRSSGLILEVGDQVFVTSEIAPPAHSYFEITTSWRFIDNDGDTSDADWRLITLVHDAAFAELRVYVDHWPVAAIDTTGSSLADGLPSPSLTFGASPDGSGGFSEHFTGAIDEIRILNYPLAAGEISDELSRLGFPYADIAPAIGSPELHPPAETTLAVNQPVTFEARFDDPDTALEDVAVNWTIYDPKFTISRGTGPTFTITPDQLGTYLVSFNVMAADDRSAGSSFQSFTVAETAEPPDPPFAIATAPAPATADVDETITVTVSGSGGTPPYTFGIGGSLPDGWTFSSDTNELTGSGDEPGFVPVTIVGSDAAGAKVRHVFRIVILPTDSDGDGFPDHWEMARNGNLAMTPQSDDDFNGIPLLVEYALGRDIRKVRNRLIEVGQTRGPMANGSDRYLVLRHQVRSSLGGVTVNIMASDNLSGWDPVDGNSTVISDDGEVRVIETRVPLATANRAFFRIEVD